MRAARAGPGAGLGNLTVLVRPGRVEPPPRVGWPSSPTRLRPPAGCFACPALSSMSYWPGPTRSCPATGQVAEWNGPVAPLRRGRWRCSGSCSLPAWTTIASLPQPRFCPGSPGTRRRWRQSPSGCSTALPLAGAEPRQLPDAALAPNDHLQPTSRSELLSPQKRPRGILSATAVVRTPTVSGRPVCSSEGSLPPRRLTSAPSPSGGQARVRWRRC